MGNIVMGSNVVIQYAKTNRRMKSNQGKIRKSVNISAASYMMKLANASTTGAVAGILRAARADQSFVKRSGASQQEINKALGIIKRVIAKGNRKIACLKKEQSLENNRRIARNNGNQEEMERLKKELRKRRKARKARERAEMADMEQVTIHEHSDNEVYPDALSMDGLIHDLSNTLPMENSIHAEIGADTGVCCADTADLPVVDVVI